MFAVMRFEKLKTYGNIGGVEGHCARTRPTPNADPEKTKFNRWLVGDGDMVNAVKKRIGDRKIRKNAVYAVEFLLTASPEYFRPGRSEQGGHYEESCVKTFEQASLAWLRTEFGADNVVSAIIHLDEQTPHLHAVIVPISPVTDKLNASHWFDGKKSLAQLQTRYAQAVNHLGLHRGKEHSTATHIRISEYYDNVNAAKPPVLAKLAVEPPPPILISANARNDWAKTESGRLTSSQKPTLQPVADAAAEQQREKERRQAAESRAATLEYRYDLDRIRDIPLPEIFKLCDYTRDPNDKNQYLGPWGRISIETKNGKAKFYNHASGKGGGGAIDLIMHLEGFDFTGACAFLRQHFEADAIIKAAAHKAMNDAAEAINAPVSLPQPDDSTWPKVLNYLVSVRKLAAPMIDKLHNTGAIFADFRGNACFRFGDDGIELRGTSAQKWRGFRGKKTDFFRLSPVGEARGLAVVESAIEAISYAELYPDVRVIGLAGLGAKTQIKAVCAGLLKDQTLYAAFNADDAGDNAALHLTVAAKSKGFNVERNRPPEGQDWNDVLQLQKSTPSIINTDADTLAEDQGADENDDQVNDDHSPANGLS